MSSLPKARISRMNTEFPQSIRVNRIIRIVRGFWQ